MPTRRRREYVVREAEKPRGKVMARASWSRETPQEVILRGARSKTVRVSSENAELMRRSLELSLKEPRVGFYEPQAKRQPSGADARFRPHRMRWKEQRGISGSLEVWGPAIPGEMGPVPEPRVILFAGEGAHVVIALRNGDDAPLEVRGARVEGSSVFRGGKTKPEAVMPGGEIQFAIPIKVAVSAKAGYAPMRVSIPCRMGKRTFTLTHDLHLSVGRLVRFQHKVGRPGHDGKFIIDMSLTADVPGGFREAVSARFEGYARVGKDGNASFGLSPLSYDASVTLPDGGRVLHAATLPADLYMAAALGDFGRRIARGIFQAATAAIMAALATVGVQVTKAALALAAQALGPAVGVPVTLVLYSPPVEAWFAKAAILILSVTGFELNGDLYDMIFPPEEEKPAK